MIDWGAIKDRHMEGKSPLGRVWIRTDNTGKVIAMYTQFGTTEKYLPSEEWMEDLVGAQLELERLENLERFCRKHGNSSKKN